MNNIHLTKLLSMKKKIFFLPLILAGVFGIVLWSCDSTSEEEDLCLAFELPDEFLTCDEPTICCPMDEGDCYIINPDGANYYCDKDLATTNDPDGCSDAEDRYINEKCTTKMSPEQTKEMKKLLNSYIKEVMEKARINSVC
jgi:hypothetical protein